MTATRQRWLLALATVAMGAALRAEEPGEAAPPAVRVLDESDISPLATGPVLFAPGTPPDLLLGVHLPAWTLTEPAEGVSPAETPVLRQQISDNLDWITRQGYSTLLLDVMDRQGTYHFESEVLSRAGYQPGPKVVPIILEEAHARNLKVLADISVLADRLRPGRDAGEDSAPPPLSIEEVRAVVSSLLDGYHLDGVVESGFPAEYVAGIQLAAATRDSLHVHRFDDPWGQADVLLGADHVGFLTSEEQARRVAEADAGSSRMGTTALLLSHARALGVPGWVEVTASGAHLPPEAGINVLLLRAVQYRPAACFLAAETRSGLEWIRKVDPRRLREQLEEVSQPVPGPRLLANVVLALPLGPEHRASSLRLARRTYGPVSAGLMLAGYEVVVTYRHPLPDADAYVVLTRGQTPDGEVLAPPAEAVGLLEGEVPVAFVVDGLTHAAGWGKLLPALGIDPDWTLKGMAEGAVPETQYEGRKLRWTGILVDGAPVRTSFLDPEQVTGRVLASAVVAGRHVALAVRNGSRFLINAGGLHLETAFLFNQVFGGALRAPFLGQGTVGSRCAFLALDHTPVSLRLPFAPETQLQITRYAPGGKILGRGQLPYAPPFETSLEPYQLLLVEPAGR